MLALKIIMLCILGPDDYVALNNTRLVFAPYEEIVCTQITIIDDVILEQTESFTVTLSIYDDPSGRVVLGRPEAVIGILDDDGKMESMHNIIFVLLCIHLIHYDVNSISIFIKDAVIALELEDCDVSEDEGTVNVCVVVVEPNIVCPVEFPFELILKTSPITAGTIFIQYHTLTNDFVHSQRPMLTISLQTIL